MNRPDWIGQRLGGRYQIQGVIGQGGMSSVYKALDPNLQRVVAIKLIHPHLSSDPKFMARFEEEARAVARLRHPNIVQVYDFNNDGDVYYMVQEYVPGETLQSILRRLNESGERMPISEAVRYAAEVCSAIDYAHKLGMIHRDIKPANIMIDERGQAILMDFGIVKLLEGDAHTTTGTVVGTVAYMSPDLMRGEAPDARSDIYSLGVTLFEMLSGRPPFQSDSAITLMMMHQNDPVPDLHPLRLDAPEDLIGIVQKSLAKSREGRFGTTDEMGQALRRVNERIARGELEVTGRIEGAGPAVVGGVAAGPSATYVQPGRGQTTAFSNGRGAGAAAGEPPAPAIPATPAPKTAQRRGMWPALVGAAAVVLIALALIGVFALRGGSGGGKASALEAGATSTAAQGAPAALAPEAATGSPTPTSAPTQAAQSTVSQPALQPAALQPSAVPAVTPAIPSDRPYVQISQVVIDSQDRYVVAFEVLNQDKQKAGDQVDFFFNTAPRNAGGFPQEDLTIYSGASPFTILKVGARPQAASQICALMAQADAGMVEGSGNCAALPDVASAAANADLDCRAGPGMAYAVVSKMKAGASALVQGLSPDESWWYVSDPEGAQNGCWAPANATTFSGDIASVKLVEPPPAPTATPAGEAPYVEITDVTVDTQGEYVVNYVARNFTPQLPGTHMHFFFDTTPADQTGINGSGSRLMFGGPAPFIGFKVSDRPLDATAMCVLVANPDHTVQPGSGNCFPLP